MQFEEGIEKTVRWYLDNQEWMDRSAIKTLSQSFASERISRVVSTRNITKNSIRIDDCFRLWADNCHFASYINDYHFSKAHAII